MKELRHILTIVAAVGVALSFTGCVRPYDTPEYVEVKANETAYVIPLEGAADQGVKFDSEAYLDSKKVATKRIQIPHRWNQLGRETLGANGEWIDTVRVITVDRAPVTRQWEAGAKSKNALWMESSDSIGFSTGFSVTAYVEEADTSRFLYSYKATSLAEVLDTELRARIQSVASRISASYKMDVLREKKNELIDAVRADVVDFFKKKGITITTIGQFGGFAYENEAIQKAIDETFVAQQEKVRAKAQLDAVADQNLRTEQLATAAAQAARTKAQGEADGKLAVFRAEADGISAVNKALSDANQNPQLVDLKRLDVERVKAEKWDGKMPVWVHGGGQGMILNIQDAPK